MQKIFSFGKQSKTDEHFLYVHLLSQGIFENKTHFQMLASVYNATWAKKFNYLFKKINGFLIFAK